ncbi:transcriptional repressor LexA [Actinomyces wuliandei]|uniref:transcriptional repressor LexA n=1 Tax=Actinomyces wuliandei TaxID=2057743 RepID=UPI000FDAD8A5|nr:transcriptional repressor LexA [Actinomyces wuliandei]
MSTTTSHGRHAAVGTRTRGTGAPATSRLLADLDVRARAVYEAVREAVESRGYPPSLREIGTTVGLTSPSSVKHQLDKLERLGLLRRDPRRPRAMEVVTPGNARTDQEARRCPVGSAGAAGQAPAPSRAEDVPRAPRGLLSAGEPQTEETVPVPLVGHIAAGAPILAEQQWEEVMPLPRRLTGGGDLFMLRVQGDSMTEAAICDGDWVVVRAQPDAQAGEVVAAMIEEPDGASATVKVLSRRDGHQWLLPRNPAYAPIDGDKATIMGKVVAVLRSL